MRDGGMGKRHLTERQDARDKLKANEFLAGG
jgi:hypothetical protein